VSALLLDSARVAANRAGGDRWVISGVAAELARRLGASAAVLRAALFIAFVLEPGGVLIAYAAAAVVLPRGDRPRPGWSALVALARFGLAWTAVQASSAGLPSTALKVGPEYWLTSCGVALGGIVLLVASAPQAGAVDESHCRRLVAGALPALALAGLLAAGMALVPDWRWERIAAVSVIALAPAVALGRAHAVPAAVLAAMVVFLAGTGARLQGGIGDVRVAPRTVHYILTVRRAFGDSTVDLRQLEPAPAAVRASVGVGKLTVVVPEGADVTTRLRVGRGTLDTGSPREGIELHASPSIHGRGTHRFALLIVGDVGVGTLRVVSEGNDP
jgi:phage shock protein PspC (stress-responsive transcriptional regulator)